MLSGSATEITTSCVSCASFGERPGSSGPWRKWEDRQINIYLGHAECNKNDETYGKEQNIQISWKKQEIRKQDLREGLKKLEIRFKKCTKGMLIFGRK